MKTKLVRPILLDSEEWQPLALSTSRYGGLFKSEYYTPMTEMGDTYKVLILVSLDPDEKIEVGDEVYNEECQILGRVTQIGKLIKSHPQPIYSFGFFTGYTDETTHLVHQLQCEGFRNQSSINKTKKVIATYSQLSPELIQQLINEYNNGGMKDFEIELKSIGAYSNPKYLSDYEIKLTNGFITPVTKEEKLYTKSDLKEAFLEAAERFMGMGVGFDEWFEQFKQKNYEKANSFTTNN